MASVFFHIIAKQAWVDAKRSGEYSPPGLASEGFIHLSKRDQILRPANLLYHGHDDLLLLVINGDELSAEVIFEPGSHGEAELFPHLFGTLDLAAVIDVVPFPCSADGSFVLPSGLPAA